MDLFLAFLLVCGHVGRMQLAAGESAQLTPHQQMLSDLWDAHCQYEFDPSHKSVAKTMETMTEQPHVNHIPTSIGGTGKRMLSHFYGEHFIFSNPEMTLKTVSWAPGARAYLLGSSWCIGWAWTAGCLFLFLTKTFFTQSRLSWFWDFNTWQFLLTHEFKTPAREFFEFWCCEPAVFHSSLRDAI